VISVIGNRLKCRQSFLRINEGMVFTGLMAQHWAMQLPVLAVVAAVAVAVAAVAVAAGQTPSRYSFVLLQSFFGMV
jgi:hypothetical protein